MIMVILMLFFFFFNDTATTEIYTLSLHDALPILSRPPVVLMDWQAAPWSRAPGPVPGWGFARLAPSLPGCHVWPSTLAVPDRKSTRLNSSHANISYAVFCLKKKKTSNMLI